MQISKLYRCKKRETTNKLFGFGRKAHAKQSLIKSSFIEPIGTTEIPHGIKNYEKVSIPNSETNSELLNSHQNNFIESLMTSSSLPQRIRNIDEWKIRSEDKNEEQTSKFVLKKYKIFDKVTDEIKYLIK